jgi:hypothetical protein
MPLNYPAALMRYAQTDESVALLNGQTIKPAKNFIADDKQGYLGWRNGRQRICG